MNRRMIQVRIGYLALTVLLAACDKPAQAPRSDSLANSAARPATSVSTPTPPALDNNDQAFIAESAGDNAFQIAMARLALQRSSRTDVRQLAQKIMDDHTRMNSELVAISEQRGNNPYAAAVPVDKSRQMQDRLGALQGDAFDQAFTELMVTDHQASIVRFSTEARNGHDEAMRAFASKALPILRGHLEMAKTLNNRHSASK